MRLRKIKKSKELRNFTLLVITIAIGTIYFNGELNIIPLTMIFMLGCVFSIDNDFRVDNDWMFKFLNNQLLQDKSHLDYFKPIKRLMILRLITEIILATLLIISLVAESFNVTLLLSFLLWYDRMEESL